MNPNTATLPDNLISRLSRVYVRQNEFKDESGKVVSYKRLVLATTVKGESVDIELKADKKDLLLLGLADVVDSEKAF